MKSSTLELNIFLFEVVLGNFTDYISKILSATIEQKSWTPLLPKSTIHFPFYHFILSYVICHTIIENKLLIMWDK